MSDRAPVDTITDRARCSISSPVEGSGAQTRKGWAGKVDPTDLGGQELRPESGGLGPHVAHQLGSRQTRRRNPG